MQILLFDMGLPMIIPSLYLMGIGLVPIIALEAVIVANQLDLKLRDVLLPVGLANIVSTLIGIPVTWFALLFVELVCEALLGLINPGPTLYALFSMTLGSPWVGPSGTDDDGLRILFAILFLLIPYWFASWWIEALVAYRWLDSRLGSRDQDRSETVNTFPSISRAVRNANVYSYLVLAIAAIVIFAATASHRH